MSIVDERMAVSASIASVSTRKQLPRSVLTGMAISGDLVAAAGAIFIALESRFGGTGYSITGLGALSYSFLLVALPFVWGLLVAAFGGYRWRALSPGGDAIGPTAAAALSLLAIFGVTSLTFHADLSRDVVAKTVVFTPVLSAGFRYLTTRTFTRVLMHSHSALARAVIVGDSLHIDRFLEHVDATRGVGFEIAAVLLDSELDASDIPGAVVARALSTGSDMLVVVGSHRFSPDTLRRLAWRLEGTGIDLMVAPGLVQVAVPRLSVHSIAGVPLLAVEAPVFDGFPRMIKQTFDIIAGFALLVTLSPVLLVVSILIFAADRRQPFFSQVRVGKNGARFRMLKFRTMVSGAEQMLGEIEHLNEIEGPLFKIQSDPRVTRIGRFLRRYSLDELPQLINVVRGEMSLVGPRPALPSEVAQYPDDARRRLLVKPGITGMWQVSGRARLAWREAVRLDLYYVENWSLTLDLVLLLRTIGAVLTTEGAY